tara:strand:- start:128 stop:1147 length:1020 start_codon:yes stop_codon:yes gene_type:complete
MMKNDFPSLSVVCAWYQRPDFIAGTLDSLLRQTLADFEIIIVNDGSPDPSVQAALLGYVGSGVVVVNQENSGFVGAITKAIELAQGEFIAIQGAGDISYPERLEKQLALMHSDAGVAVVGCGYETLVKNNYGEDSRIRNLPAATSFELADILQGRTGFTHGSLMFRRSMLEDVGGYRRFFKYGQDRDLLIRLMEKGWVGKNVPEVLYQRYAFESDGVSGSKRKLLIQQALVSFALQCHQDRKRNGIDYVDLYGADAMLFRKPDKKLANYAAKLGLISLLVDDDHMAEEFLRISLREKPVFWGAVLCFMSRALWRVRFLRNLVHLVASKHPRYQSWVSKR